MTESERRRLESTRRRFLQAAGAGVAIAGLASPTVAAGSVKHRGAARSASGAIPSTLASAIEIDTENATVTLPLYRGTGPDGGEVYYVLTDASDVDAASRLGVNWAPKLGNALGTPAVQTVAGPGNGGRSPRFDPRGRGWTFDGTVDFGPDRYVEPGPEGFPIDAERSRPGAVGDDRYSPFVTTGDGAVYNTPHVANDTGTHDRVVGDLDTDRMRVTLALTGGFYEGRPTWYPSTDAYPADVAALEGATFAATLAAAPAAGDRDLESSAREPIFPVVNGPMGADNPQRQGLRSAVAGEGGPLNVVRSEQACADPRDPTDCSVFYSPLWDVHPIVWAERAIEAGHRRRLTSHEEIVDGVLAGDLESGAPDGPVDTQVANVHAAVAAVNCPLVLVEGEGMDGTGM
ncbi:MAG: hypothetical protein ABEJ28_06890 [Salinigranum sp.]